ncbi:MAG: LPD7 domain-containing protein, partial [Gemmobacter sp.]|nr:LPD7 domain-containing protein [Gemmobacter sp.]
GSGARIGIIGSTEFAKASAFGSKYSIAKMEAAFGPFRRPKEPYVNDLKIDHVAIGSITCAPSSEGEKITRAAAFKVTLLRRTYTELHLDPVIAEAIRFVGLADRPPQITFKDGTTIVDHGDKLSTSQSTRETRATMLSMIKAKGWPAVTLTGPPDFIRQMALECAGAGLAVHGLPPAIQLLADQALAQARERQSQIEQATQVALEGHLQDQVTREAALATNAEDRAHRAAQAAEITDEAKAVQDAIGFSRNPLSSAFRKFAQEDRDRKLAELPDRRKAPSPQPSPDVAKRDGDGLRRIAQHLRENDQDEIERMKHLDISLIAASGGWADVSLTHADSSDRHGKKYRIYQRGGDTIKASLTAGKWLWTSNKSGAAGSVIDLWLQDNPGRSLGHARAALRDLMGFAPVMAPEASPATREAPQEHDHTDARRRWEQAPYIDERRSYAEDRGISRETLRRFSNEVRMGAFGGIYFAHRNLDTSDIQGFEQRWEKDGQKNQARFAKGGRKTVNVLGDPSTATRMVVVEGGLDALAFAELDNRYDTIYVSTGGGFGPMSEAALCRLADGKTVISAFDNDEAGEQLHGKLRLVLPDAVRSGPFPRLEGSMLQCKDWLDVLNVQKAGVVEQNSVPMEDVVEENKPSFETEMPDSEQPYLSGPD